MANSGSVSKPFLYTERETETRYIGRIIWYYRRNEKVMSSIGDETKPYYVKTYESDFKKIFGILVRDREQNWEYDKL